MSAEHDPLIILVGRFLTFYRQIWKTNELLAILLTFRMWIYSIYYVYSKVAKEN